MKDPHGEWEAFEDYVLDFAIETLKRGEKLALVTLVKIEGSSPRFLGAQMAISETGNWVGYLSGGCIERAVVAEALEAIAAGESRLVRYGRGSKYFDIQLPCGSAIELFFDVDADLNTLDEIDGRLKHRQVAELVIDEGNRFGAHMLRVYRPRKRLVIAGVGPATVQLARMAQIAGFEVVAWSYDEPTLQRLSSFNVATTHLTSPNRTPPFEADARTAIVFMFHDHDWDLALLPSALATDAFYIGAMGSRPTHRLRLQRLEEQGFDRASLNRINGPAGLFAGSKSAGDIALSILAELVHVDQTRVKTRIAENDGEPSQTSLAHVFGSA